MKSRLPSKSKKSHDGDTPIFLRLGQIEVKHWTLTLWDLQEIIQIRALFSSPDPKLEAPCRFANISIVWDGNDCEVGDSYFQFLP